VTETFPTLYRKTSAGKIQQWTISAVDNTVCTEYGPLGGKLQQTSKIIRGKNSGRKNATSDAEQAVLEAQRMWKNKRDRKYRETIDAASERILLPMLANKYIDLKKPLQFPIYVQPKLNGVRCLAFLRDDQVVLLSREGTEYTIPHLQQELLRHLVPNLVIDGEVYIHGVPLQDIGSLVKRAQPESETLEFHVFDVLSLDTEEEPFRSRLHERVELIQLELDPDSHIRVVETSLAETEEDIYFFLEQFEDNGYEGIIIRKPEGIYHLAQRTSDLLKLKNFMDEEFEIVGYFHGSGREEECVVWQCKTVEGKPFETRPMGTLEQRKEWFRRADEFIGKMLTVKFQEYSNEGIPIFPVGITIRDYE